MKIPSIKLSFNENQRKFILSSTEKLVNEGAFLSTGEYCDRFEKEFASYSGAKYAIATSSSTSALEILLRGLGVKEGNVLISTNTYPLAAATVLRTGAKPEFVDVGNDLSITAEKVKEKISEKTKAVVMMHPGGLISPQIKKIREICQQKQIPFLEDSHYAHGSEFENKKSGSLGDGAVFSFFSPKPFTTGEGGMITLNDDKLYEKSLYIKNIDHETLHKTEGYEWKMTEMQAIFGIAGLSGLDDNIRDKGRIFQVYDEILDDNVKILKPHSSVKYNNSKYIVLLPENIEREKLRVYLREKYTVSLSGPVYSIPCHLQPPYKDLGKGKGSLPVAEKLCPGHICLPVYPNMEQEEISYAAESLLSTIKQF